LPYTLPRYMLLDLPRDVIRSVARFRLRAHTLQIGTVNWTHNTSLTCDLCNANDVQDEQHVLFHCTHPHVVSLQRTYTFLFPPEASNCNWKNRSALFQSSSVLRLEPSWPSVACLSSLTVRVHLVLAPDVYACQNLSRSWKKGCLFNWPVLLGVCRTKCNKMKAALLRSSSTCAWGKSDLK